MELIAVPLKKPTEVDFLKPLQNAIRSSYNAGTKVKDYSESIQELNKLRSNALWRAFEKYESSLEVIYRYYDQLSALEAKIPSHELQIPFKWKDAFDRTIFGGKLSLTISTLAYEKVCVLFNIGALQSSVAAGQSMDSDEGLKLATKLFQQAAGVFSYLKTSTMLAIQQEPTPDMSPETLEALAALMLAQGQEIFTLKAIHDNMKEAIIAKLAAQTEELYAEALKLFQKEIFRAFWDKDWVPTLAAKQAGYRAMAEYFQSLVCKNSKNIGEEIARLDHALELFKTAHNRCPKIVFFQEYSSKAERNLAEVKKDNDFIYHARIPDFKTLDPIAKAPIAKMTSVPAKFSSNFRDLFADLLPVPIHHALANYESTKNEVVNNEIAKLREMKQVLNATLASLNLPAAIEDTSGAQVPQSIIDKSKYIKEAGGIAALEKIMKDLPELFQRNKDILDESQKMLDEEEKADSNLREQFKERWTRLPSSKLTEQFKVNIQKYRGIINNAINADKIVRQKFDTHREAVNILSMNESELGRMIPAGAAVRESHVVNELRKLMEDVETIKAEQDVMESELQSATADIKSQFLSALIKDGVIDEQTIIKEGIQSCFGALQTQIQECEERQKKLILEIQNKHSQFTREQACTGNAREEMLRKLACAYDVFKELKNNLKEGVTFYNDLTQLLITLQNKISDFCFARKTEKEEFLKDLTITSSQSDKSAPSIEIPTHHSQLPYPSVSTGMPLPYGATIQTPYPAYAPPPPMPATYNPYATMPYPMQPNYVVQPPQMQAQVPYGGYVTLPRQGNYHPPGGNM